MNTTGKNPSFQSQEPLTDDWTRRAIRGVGLQLSFRWALFTAIRVSRQNYSADNTG